MRQCVLIPSVSLLYMKGPVVLFLSFLMYHFHDHQRPFQGGTYSLLRSCIWEAGVHSSFFTLWADIEVDEILLIFPLIFSRKSHLYNRMFFVKEFNEDLEGLS